jgi:hypothetical protein
MSLITRTAGVLALVACVGCATMDGTRPVPGPEHELYAHMPSGDQAVYERLYSEVLRPLRERLSARSSDIFGNG